MAGIYGADVAQLRALAQDFKRGSTALQFQSKQLSDSIMSNPSWTGPDAARFRNEWNTGHRQALLAASRQLEESSKVLLRNAKEQEDASAAAGGTIGGGVVGYGPGVLKDTFDVGKGVKTVGSALWQAYKLGKLKWEEYAKTREVLTDWRAGGAVLRDALDSLRNGGKITDVIADLKANIPYSEPFLKVSKLAEDGTQILEDASKFSKGMRIAGGLAAPLNIVGGIHDMISPEHDGWRGAGDRVAGGLSVVGGVGSIMLMTAGGAAMLGPIGAPIVVGAGLVAGAWALGNLVADHWDSITSFGKTTWENVTNFAKDPGGYIADGAQEVGNFAKDVGTKVVDGIGNAAKSVGNFLGGVFG